MSYVFTPPFLNQYVYNTISQKISRKYLSIYFQVIIQSKLCFSKVCNLSFYYIFNWFHSLIKAEVVAVGQYLIGPFLPCKYMFGCVPFFNFLVLSIIDRGNELIVTLQNSYWDFSQSLPMSSKSLKVLLSILKGN